MEDQQVYEDFKAPLEKLVKNTKNVDLQVSINRLSKYLFSSKYPNFWRKSRPSITVA